MNRINIINFRPWCSDVETSLGSSTSDCSDGLLHHLAARPGEGVARFHQLDGLLHRVMLKDSKVQGYHLGRSIDPCRAMDVHLQPLLDEIVQDSESSLSSLNEIIVVHILNGVPLVLDPVLLAEELEEVRRYAMVLEISLALNGKNSRNIVFLEHFEIRTAFGVAADVDLGGDLGELEVVEAAVVVDGDFGPVVGDSFPLGVHFALVEEVKDSSWLAFALYYFTLLDEIVSEFLPVAEGVERKAEDIIFFLF